SHRTLALRLRQWPIVARGRRLRRRSRRTSTCRGCRGCSRPATGLIGAAVGAAEGVSPRGGCTPTPRPCFAGALGRFRLALAHGLLERQPLSGNLGFRKRRLHAAQLGNQRGPCPLVKRTAALAGGAWVQSGNSASDQRVVIGHISSTVWLS